MKREWGLRFDGNALSCLQGGFAGLTGGVVDVEADVVAQVVGEEGFEGLIIFVYKCLVIFLFGQGRGDD